MIKIMKVRVMDKIYAIDELKEKLHPIFVDAPVYQAILFGSYAKGIADDKSDIDIVLDSHGELRGISFFGILEDVVIALDKKIDLFEISEIRPNSPIMGEIMNEGVVLYERKG